MNLQQLANCKKIKKNNKKKSNGTKETERKHKKKTFLRAFRFHFVLNFSI